MATRGVFFALSAEDEARLLACESDEALIAFIRDELDEEGDGDWIVAVAQAWDGMHRCLEGVGMGATGNSLSEFVLGGRALTKSNEFIVSYVDAAVVPELAVAVAGVSEEEMRARYDQLGESGYHGPRGDEDWAYTWQHFLAARALYEKAAAAGRAMLFSVEL